MLYALRKPESAHQVAHWRKAVPLRVLREGIHSAEQSENTQENPRRGKAGEAELSTSAAPSAREDPSTESVLYRTHVQRHETPNVMLNLRLALRGTLYTASVT